MREDNINIYLKEYICLRVETGASFCKHRNKTSASINGAGFLN